MFQMGEKAADGERARRDAMAKAAAPYVHPTLSAANMGLSPKLGAFTSERLLKNPVRLLVWVRLN
jgi:hypothetical protein